jgi:hypothetical protein
MRRTETARARIPALVALGTIPLLLHFLIVETSRAHHDWHHGIFGLVRFGFVTVLAITHWSIYGGLLLTFALTLRPGRDALITAMARRLHGAISTELVVYTRRVTWAWCCFFATQLTASVLLFLFAPIVVWSFFVNVLDLPLVAVMFLAEYKCRLRCLRNPPRHSLAQIIRMVTDVRKPVGEPTSLP